MTVTVKAPYIHKFSALSEQSIPAIIATLKQGGCNRVAVKTHEGTTYESSFDNNRLAINGLDRIKAYRDEFGAAGIDFRGYCNPRLDNTLAEANLAIQVGKALGGVIELDIESWGGFQDTSDKRKRLREYGQLVLNAGVKLVVDTDVRLSNFGPFDADAPGALKWLFGVAEEVWSQTYWTTFKLTAAQAINGSMALLSKYGVLGAKVGHIFPYQDPGSYPGAVAAMEAKGSHMVGLWVMGLAGTADYSTLAKIALAPTVAQPITPPATPPIAPPIIVVVPPAVTPGTMPVPVEVFPVKPIVSTLPPGPWTGIGAGLADYAKAHPQYGLPSVRMAAFDHFDLDHNEYLWTNTATNAYTHIYNASTGEIVTAPWQKGL
jgi:hypothetical protein